MAMKINPDIPAGTLRQMLLSAKGELRDAILARIAELEPAAAPTVIVKAPQVAGLRLDRVRGVLPEYLAVWRALNLMAGERVDRVVVSTYTRIGTVAKRYIGRNVAPETVKCALQYLDADLRVIEVKAWPVVDKATRWRGQVTFTPGEYRVPEPDSLDTAAVRARIAATQKQVANPKAAARQQRFRDRRRAGLPVTSTGLFVGTA
jgi:hypothetical protein